MHKTFVIIVSSIYQIMMMGSLEDMIVESQTKPADLPEVSYCKIFRIPLNYQQMAVVL
jgi:hypothetical protein